MSILNADDHAGWRVDAACTQHDPETWFPEKGTPTLMQQVNDAKKICAGCPVKIQCLEDALATGDVYGIRAGLGEKERRKLHRAREAA